MRRNGGRQEPHGVQATLFPAAFRQKQMPIVDWIKSAAEDAESHFKGKCRNLNDEGMTKYK
jgi:hypothetical protein